MSKKHSSNHFDGFVGQLLAATIVAFVTIITAGNVLDNWLVFITGIIFGIIFGFVFVKIFVNSKWKKKYEELASEVTWWKNEDYHILLDGAESSGKSALVAKWANPAVKIEKLSKSAGLAEIPIYLCSKFSNSNDGKREEIRYRLTFQDVPGEHNGLLSDVIYDNKGIHFLILVVDPTNPEISFQRLNPTHLKDLYTGQIFMKKINSVLIYISKSDLLNSPDDLQSVKDRVREEIIDIFRPFGIKPFVFVGSAKTGNGLYDALGYIVKKVDVEQYFIKHQSIVERN